VERMKANIERRDAERKMAEAERQELERSAAATLAARTERERDKERAMAERQQAMLARAASLVKPGGRLVYSVCSLEPEEGERVADAFLASHSGFAIDPIRPEELPAGLMPDAAGRVRVLPGAFADQGGADGFFVVRFRRG